jgi:hypothetical protein
MSRPARQAGTRYTRRLKCSAAPAQAAQSHPQQRHQRSGADDQRHDQQRGEKQVSQVTGRHAELIDGDPDQGAQGQYPEQYRAIVTPAGPAQNSAL